MTEITRPSPAGSTDSHAVAAAWAARTEGSSARMLLSSAPGSAGGCPTRIRLPVPADGAAAMYATPSGYTGTLSPAPGFSAMPSASGSLLASSAAGTTTCGTTLAGGWVTPGPAAAAAASSLLAELNAGTKSLPR